MTFRSRALPGFWDLFDELPEEIQRRAEKQYRLFAENPFHPSLHFKPVGNFWSVRVNDNYRALAFRKDNDFIWFWIGQHDEYAMQSGIVLAALLANNRDAAVILGEDSSGRGVAIMRSCFSSASNPMPLI